LHSSWEYFIRHNDFETIFIPLYPLRRLAQPLLSARDQIRRVPISECTLQQDILHIPPVRIDLGACFRKHLHWFPLVRRAGGHAATVVAPVHIGSALLAGADGRSRQVDPLQLPDAEVECVLGGGRVQCGRADTADPLLDRDCRLCGRVDHHPQCTPAGEEHLQLHRHSQTSGRID